MLYNIKSLNVHPLSFICYKMPIWWYFNKVLKGDPDAFFGGLLRFFYHSLIGL
jgi:hypothetical protein